MTWSVIGERKSGTKGKPIKAKRMPTAYASELIEFERVSSTTRPGLSRAVQLIENLYEKMEIDEPEQLR